MAFSPLLTIVTRHLPRRERLLAVCRASIDMQTDQDLQHLVIVDNVGRGLSWANRQFVAHADEVRGDYVFILDDDDRLVRDDFVASIREVAGPKLIVVRMDHQRREGGHIEPFVLPKSGDWGRGCPPFASIGVSAVVVRRDVWVEAIEDFAPRRGGDYPFFQTCFELAGDDVKWLDRVMSQCQRPLRERLI